MTPAEISIENNASRSESAALVAMSGDGTCMVTSDGTVVRLAGGRALIGATSVVHVAVVDSAVWIVSRGTAGHALHRFDVTGWPIAPALPLGELGETVRVDANRIGLRAMLVEGERAVLVRERDGEAVVEQLGHRGAARRVLVGARGVGERIGNAVKLRTGSLPPLALPLDLRGHAIGAAAVVHDGSAFVLELVGHDTATALVYELRSGALRKRIRLGELRVLAIAEQAGMLVLGRGAHVAMLDLRAGKCASERILPAPARACATDTHGTRVVVLDESGTLHSLGSALTEPSPVSKEGARGEPHAVEAREHERAPKDGAERQDLVEQEPEAGACPGPAGHIAEPRNEPTPQPDPAIPLVSPTQHEDLAALATLPLEALGPARAARPLAGDALLEYLHDARTWIQSLCTTAVAIACDDRAAISEARKREREAAESFSRWNRRGSPHVEVARELGLGPLAGTILLLVAAPQIWGELIEAYEACAGERSRSLVDEWVLAQVLEADVPLRSSIACELDDDSVLVRSGAIEVGEGMRPYAPLRAHPAIVRRLAGVASPEPSCELQLEEFVGPRRAIGSLVRSLVEPRPRPPRIVLRGARGAGRRTLATLLARQAGRAVAVVELGDLDTLAERLQTVALRGQLACLDLDDWADSVAARVKLRAIVDEHARPLFVRAPAEGDVPLAPGYDEIALPPLSESERREAWRARLSAHGLDVTLAYSLASRFAIGPGAIARACAFADTRDRGDAAASLVMAIRQMRSKRMSTVAEQIEHLASWDDLVVGDDIAEALRELVVRVRHRRTVLEAWGLGRVASTARGVTALFQGGPGTGKTMAAGVIANALGYELWRVDLSRILSKWIGETEKNLAAVFEAAEEGEVVLLFDEADALFSRRTDPKSNNDKHANVATNYLLQRLDCFRGIAVLTTNLGTAIDPAFKRRMSVTVQFAFPDEDERERIWRAHLPPSVPTAGDLELATLARQYQLSGGYIRNAVLRAAYLAADDAGAITAEHLHRAVRLEKERIGKLGDGRFE